MNYPFEDLRRDRERREKEIAEEQTRSRKAAILAYESFQETAKRFSGLVMPILEQLREAKYPNHSVVDCFSKARLSDGGEFESEGTWQIGRSAGYSANERYWWESTVKVELELDPQTKQPIGFICHRNGYRLAKARKTLIESILGVADKMEKTPYAPVRATLSSEDLINALKQLHPLSEEALT
jgi:hypothetical protein